MGQEKQEDKLKETNGVLQAKLWKKLEAYEKGETSIEDLKVTSGTSRSILRSALADLEFAKLKESGYDLLERSHRFFGGE